MRSDWIVFCDYGFQSVCPLMKDKRLMEASWWEWLTKGEIGLYLIDRALLSKSLVQFSVDGWGCVPSLLFTWGQTMVEVVKIIATSFRRACAGIVALSVPSLQQATATHLCWRLLDTQVWVSLLWGHCSLLLGPGANSYGYTKILVTFYFLVCQ